jgi:histidinol phosphatase-like PHP family hydrolase
MRIIDLHTHTFASDGVLLHSELIRRAAAAGYRAIGITDHGDETNLEDLLKKAVKAAGIWASNKEITVVPGVEITHVPPERIAPVAAWARDLGAKVVVVHGETITEPVAPGTNAAAVRCPDVDILAHPGLLAVEDAAAAAENGVLLEITARKGHSAANGRVAAAAAGTGAGLIFGTDTHAPGDLATVRLAKTILEAAGVGEREIEKVFENAERLLEKAVNGEY